MNIFFVIGDELITPALNGSILPGITRDSVLALGRKWGLPVSERLISIDEVVTAHENGQLKEIFGSGTAARHFAGRGVELRRPQPRDRRQPGGSPGAKILQRHHGDPIRRRRRRHGMDRAGLVWRSQTDGPRSVKNRVR